MPLAGPAVDAGDPPQGVDRALDLSLVFGERHLEAHQAGLFEQISRPLLERRPGAGEGLAGGGQIELQPVRLAQRSPGEGLKVGDALGAVAVHIQPCGRVQGETGELARLAGISPCQRCALLQQPLAETPGAEAGIVADAPPPPQHGVEPQLPPLLHGHSPLPRQLLLPNVHLPLHRGENLFVAGTSPAGTAPEGRQGRHRGGPRHPAGGAETVRAARHEMADQVRGLLCGELGAQKTLNDFRRSVLPVHPFPEERVS